MGKSTVRGNTHNVHEDINPEPRHQSFDDEHKLEAIISKEAMQRHVDTNRSVKTDRKFYLFL